MAEEETGNTFPHVCQYWVEDEPAQCSNWDEATQKCTYVPIAGEESLPSYYPLCNRIGTETDCKNYDGTGSAARCVLPDPSRHALNRETGEKWLKDEITEYEDGKCDGLGTKIKCSGYAPYHAAFGKLKPSGDEELTEAVGIDELGYRLPLIYEIYNMRARLSRCYWWEGNSAEFGISQETGEIGGEDGEKWESKCTCEDEATIEYRDFKWKDALGRDRAPCNGAKPECPCYTGVCWEYCLDEYMREGDKIMAEQILELRYYLKKDTWRPQTYRESFADPVISAWEGELFTQVDRDGQIQTIIPAIEVYMDDFDEFNIERKSVILTTGTSSDVTAGVYPTLVEEIKELPLSPIIRSVFDRLPGEPPPPPLPQKCKYFKRPSSCGYTNKSSDPEGFRPSEAESCCNAGMCSHCDRFEVDEPDMPDEIPRYVFEASKYQHKYILIVGEVFYYNSRAYGINLNDPDLEGILPPELKKYPDMYEMRASLSEERFEELYANLECVLDWLITYQPDKVCRSGASSGETSFYILMSTFFGDNEIAVFDKGSGSWEYDKINVKKLLCNGVIGQTSFSVEGSGGFISYLAGYENDFASYANKNGLITFNFFPFISSNGGNAAVVNVYNDSVRKKLAVNPALPPEFDTYDIGYELFKVKFCDSLEIELKPTGKNEFKVIGNVGLILVTIADDGRRLSNVVKPWEIKDDEIELSITRDGKTVIIEMEIINREGYIDKLEINQILIKPKDISQWVYPCKDATLSIGAIYYYEKRSFGETPEGEFEKIRDSFLTEEDIVNYDTALSLEEGDVGYSLSDFGYNSIMISVVFKGIMGRIRGQTKTKIVTWVRQPYCRDVEIYYAWYREYKKCKLLPEFDCFGSPGIKCESGHYGSVYVPPCGDHDLSQMSEKGPIWYPYEDCDSSARYNITGHLTEWDISVMEPFLSGEHGYWDMRMFGPVDQDAYTCDAHASLWACGCDWSFCNTYAVTGSFFNGWGRYRGGLTGNTKFQCIALEGTLPKFGNVFRDFLRSYRSVDNIDYYYFTGRGYQRRRKWVPVPELYSISDLTAGPSGYPFLLYSSNDYYDDGGSFVHPLGLMLAKGAIEDIDIEESIELDGGAGSPRRYKFDEIFKVDYSLAGLNYPYRKDIAMKMSGGILKPIICWYVYKDYYGSGGSNESIQWAWREIWEELKRFTFGSEDMKCGAQSSDIAMVDLFCMECVGSVPSLPQNCVEIGPYKFTCAGECRWQCMGDIEGRHVFLELDHPDYRYDATLGEHQLVCSEGTHNIWFYPPSFEEDEGGIVDRFLWFSIDEGSKRAFDPQTNEWDPPGAKKFDEEAYELYTTCTKDPWVTNVVLFAEGYDDPSESVAEEDGRVIITYDGVGEEVKTYYQRGLEAGILTDNLNELPGVEECLLGWEVLFHHRSDCVEESDSIWNNVELNKWYEAVPCLEIEYCLGAIGDGEFVEILYTLPGPKVTEEGSMSGEEKRGFPSRVVFDFMWGVGESAAGEEQTIPRLYHKPALEIYATGGDDSLYELMFTAEEMVMSSKKDGPGVVRCTYSWSVPWELRMQGAPQKVKFKFRISPTTSEIAKTSGLEKYYNSYKHVLGIKCVYIYIAGIGEASEEIETYERRYNISSGQHGDFPPHGREATGSILNPLPVDKSTVYQNDSPGGVIGMPRSEGNCKTMNKCRGRILYRCHEDKEALPAGNLGDWEQEQQKIYDAIALAGETSFAFNSVCPPGFDQQLRDIGVTVPSWACSFTNTLILPLAPVIPRVTYSAPGHYFDWDFNNLERKICGKLFARVYRDVFKYVYKKASTGEIMWDSMDAIASYYLGTGKLHTTPANYTAADADRAEHVAQTLMSISTQRELFEGKEEGVYGSASSVN